MTDVYAILKYV